MEVHHASSVRRQTGRYALRIHILRFSCCNFFFISFETVALYSIAFSTEGDAWSCRSLSHRKVCILLRRWWIHLKKKKKKKIIKGHRQKWRKKKCMSLDLESCYVFFHPSLQAIWEAPCFFFLPVSFEVY
ncbi:unnamed protein product [Eretmochelys imbricata]